MNPEVVFNSNHNSFINDWDYNEYSESEQERNIVSSLNELIRDLPVEYNDLKEVCKEYCRDRMHNFSHLYMNQHIVKEIVLDMHNVRYYQ